MIRQRVEQAREQREADQTRRQIATASYAGTLWSEARPAAPEHPYLTRKRIAPHRLRQRRDVLLVPLYADGYASGHRSGPSFSVSAKFTF